ncbi:hypothetical protein NUW54_g8460 [Trametes sanguinea]|uniref:Uncharacterized protein n=1 Tax=Trametes sanguinea TaxID=158606 RepID=A0ACC1PGD2_9APHY|nr:hypothetical protein NUW54_g8460 [Trametes sanguinea]
MMSTLFRRALYTRNLLTGSQGSSLYDGRLAYEGTAASARHSRSIHISGSRASRTHEDGTLLFRARFPTD